MTVAQSINHDFNGFSGFIFIKLLFFKNHIKQFTSCHQFHNKTPMSLVFKNIKKLDNIWMIKLFQDFNLSLHSFFFLITHFSFRKNFDCYSITWYSMLCSLHSCEASSSYRSFNFISLLNISCLLYTSPSPRD